MELSEAIAKRLKELLKEKGCTQYKLSSLTGVPQSTISTIMTKKSRTCKLDTILLLAQGLGVTAKDFFDTPLFDFDSLNID